MNKVTSYLKNVGKSITYATVEVASKKLIPEVAEFTDTNKDLFKAVYSTVANSKKSIKYGTNLAKRTQIYKDINTGINNALDDIKTGNFYNKARSDAAIDAAGESLAGGFGEFDEEFDFGDWDDGSLDDFSDEKPSSVTKGDVIIADSVAKSSNLSAQLISKTVANTSHNIIKTNMATTNMVMAQNIELVAGIRTSIAGVHESINSILKFSVDVITPHFNTQSQYFNDSMAVMKENNAILKEMLEMQRNVYKNEIEKSKSKDQFGNVFSGGTLDLTEYAKAVWKNTKNLDKSGSANMLFSDMGGSTMLGHMLSNPLGFAVTNIVEQYIPKNFAKQVASFSKTLGNMFPVMITRLNKWKRDDRGGIFSLLGNIFGLDVDTKRSIDTSKYNKGAVPFDGITRKAIVDVIPEHLSKIESLLSGASQRTYDFETGKWMTARDIKKKKDSEYENVVRSSFSELNDDIKNFIRTLETQKGMSASTKRNLEADIYKMMKEFFEGDELFSPEQIKKKSREYGYSESALMEAFGEMLSKVPVSKLSSVYANVFDNKRKYSQNMSDAEAKGYDVLRKLYDNSNTDSHLKFHDTFKDQVVGNKAGFNLLNIKDSHGLNTLDYLKQILINVSYIREFGSSGGRRSKKSQKFDAYSKSFNREYTPKELQDLIDKQNASDARYNELNYDSNVSEEEAAAIAAYGLKRKTQFSNLDEDEFKNIGKRYKEKNKWMKEMEEIPGDTFTQKWANAQSMKQKQVLIMGSLSDIARKPASLLTGMIATAEKSIYNFLFQAETDEFDDEAGSKVKGFFPAMLNKMRSSWDSLTASIDEKFITPLVKKYGLDEKWDNLKNKVKNSKPMDMLRNAKNSVKNALFKDFSGIYNYTKDSVSDVMAPVLYDKNFIKARTDAIKSRYKKLNQKDIENLRNDLSGYSAEEIEYLKQNASPELLKMIEQAGFAEGGTAIVEKGGSIQVSPGEIVNVVRSNKSGISEDRKKELNNALQHMSDIVKGRSNRTTATFAKVKRLNEKSRSVNSTVVSDTFNEAIDDLKREVVDPVKNTVNNYLGIKGDTPQEQEASIKKERNKILTTVSDIFTEMKGEGAGTVSKALIGGGVGLLSGIVGGPLIGAGIGAATSLIKNSSTVNKFLFGEDVTDGEGNIVHQGGIVSKNIQNTFKKYIPDMGKYGVTGAVASLITPFGPLAGAAIGAGVSFVKNSKTMNEMIFGEEVANEDGTTSRKGGLLTEERLKKIKKFLPKAAVGALGGMVLGPFGILGNAAIGAGAGMLTGTEEFKSLIFGEDDGQGNRIGGIKGALQEHFIDPIKDFGRNFKDDFFGFIKESMIDPLNDAITPIANEIAFQTKKVVFGIPKWFLNLGKDYIAMPILNKLEDSVMEPISRGIKSLFGGMFSRFKGLISAPFRMIGSIGNATRKHQIKQGRDVVGTAKDRLKFADDKNMGDYKYRSFDEKLSEKSEDTDYLEELTARTGMLAHGADYFDKEVKKARNELSRVVADYYKLGWFSKDKKSYKRIRQYIHDNDIESAIEELTNIKESRTTGGPLDAEASNAIARFSKANKAYQVARDNKDLFGNINSSDNEAWMEKQFGKNWRSMDSKKLFEYSRKELAKVNGKKVDKTDLFSDPTKLVTEGDRQINQTLLKIYKLLSGDKYEFQDESKNESYDNKVKSGTNRANNRIKQAKNKIRKTFSKLGFASNTIDLLYQNPKVYELVLSASANGINYDDATIEKLCGMNLSDKEIDLLKKYPSAALMEEKDIKKNLDYTRNNHGTITNNRFFGAKHFRNKNLSIFDLAGKATSDLREGRVSTMTADQLSEKGIDADKKYKWVETQYGIRRYYKNDKGDITLDMSDSETKESLEKEKEDRDSRRGFMSSISSLKDSVLGIFNRNKQKDEEEKKEPWYKKLFNGEIGSKVKFGAAILGVVTGIGALKNLWNNSKENNGVVYRIGSAVGNAVGPYINKLKNWFTNEGEYTDTENTGLQGFLNKHVYPNLFSGMNIFFGKILPALVTSFIKNIPSLIKSALTGVASLFGWWKKGNNKYKDNIRISSSQITGMSNSVATNGITSSWINNSLAGISDSTANAISNIGGDDSNKSSNSNTSDPNVSDYTLGLVDTASASTQNGTGGNNIANNILSNSTSRNNIDPNALIPEMEDIGKIYTKDSEGNLQQATYGSLQNSKEFWNEGGNIHWVFDEETQDYVMDEESQQYLDDKSAENTRMPAKELAKRLGYSSTRAFLTGKQAGIFRIGEKLASNKNLVKVGKSASKAIGKLPIVGKIYKAGSFATKSVGGIFKNAGSFGKAANEALQSTGTLSGTVSKLTKEGSIYNSNLVKRITKFVKAGFDKILNIGIVKTTIKKVLKSSGKEATESAIKKIISSISKSFIGSVTKNLAKASSKVITKLATAIGSGGVITAIFAAGDFLSGMDKAEAILKIKEPNIAQTLLAGLVNVVTNELFFGLIEASTVVDMMVDTVLPMFGVDLSDFKLARDETEKEVEEYNKAYADDLSTEDYLEKNNSFTGKAKTFLSNLNPFKKNKSTKTNTSSSNIAKSINTISTRAMYGYGISSSNKSLIRGGRGSGFISQVDNKYKSKKFNIPGDTEYQTIGNSGCAPATAANVLNYYTGQGSIMDDASKAALRYKDRNGGVTPDYFTDYLGKQGIGTYSTTSKQEMLSGISQGRPTVLLGTDPTNKAKTPYGAASSHYVLATGLDGKGNVIIQDPESKRPNALYPVKDVINQSEMGLITGRGTRSRSKSITSKVRTKLGKIGFGRGNTKEQIETQVWGTLRQAGYSEVQVAGVMGNIKHESGFDPSIVEKGSGAGFGLCQWTGGRRTSLEKFANSLRKSKNDIQVQITFLVAEMTPGGGANGYANYQFMSSSSKYDGKSYPANAFDSATDIETATKAFCFCFERPSYTLHHIDRRIESAKEYYSRFTGTEASGSILSSSSSSNASNGLFDMLSNAMLSYYDPQLISLFFGDSIADSDTSSGSEPGYINATGDALAVIQTARNEIGTKATNSKGQKYGEEYGYNNVDWCVIFCWWVFKHAGCPELFYGGSKTAGVQPLLDYYRNNNRTVGITQGKPGDLIFFNWENGTSGHHVGIIEAKNSDGSYTTIEGNTGTDSYPGGAVMRKTRYNTSKSRIIAIARPNYAAGQGTIKNQSFKTIKYYQPSEPIVRGGKIAAISNELSGRGSKASKRIATYLTNNTSSISGKGSGSSILNKSTKYLSSPTANRLTNTTYGTNSGISRHYSGKASGFSLPSLGSSNYTRSVSGTVSGSEYGISSTSTNSTDRLLSVIIEILQIIASNSEKLSEIVGLLSRALDLNLTNEDISGLSSNNAKIKNKIANALKSQGSVNGLGDSSMTSSTESLAAAMYSIARA